MIGFEWTAAKFFWYLFFMYFTLLYFTYYGMMCVGLTPNYNIASIVSTAFYNIWNLFSGFFIPRPVSSSAPSTCNCKVPEQFFFFIVNLGLCLNAENANLVEMVLLGMPRGVDAVWARRLAVRRHHHAHGGLPAGEGVPGGLVAFSVLFAALFAFAIMKLNFQKR
jgi:hypothetical protein